MRNLGGAVGGGGPNFDITVDPTRGQKSGGRVWLEAVHHLNQNLSIRHVIILLIVLITIIIIIVITKRVRFPIVGHNWNLTSTKANIFSFSH